MKKEFEGTIEMYEEKVWISTRTKEGYARVLERIDPLLCKWASKTYMSGYAFEDIKQELSLIIIEGVNAYDPSKKVKLSTFLHTHLRNKLVSKLKSVNKLSNDAYGLSEIGKAEICSCGGVLTKGDSYYTCGECGVQHKQLYRRSREELIFSQMPKTDPGSGEEYGEFQSSLSNSDGLYSGGISLHNNVELEMAIDKLSKVIDDKTFLILKMVCLEGYSIKDAAGKVGLTGWAASMRLKKLGRFKIINDILQEYLAK